MGLDILTGTRVREKRMAAGLRQADLAETVGISPSYLNLIEHNRRKVSPDLLTRLAEGLGIDPRGLAEGAGGALVEALRTAAAEAVAKDAPVLAELDRIEDFAGRFPGWAELLASQTRRIAGLSRAVEALNDRLSHDPQLSAAIHDMLTTVASVRSTAAILAETPDLEPDWQARFLGNLHADSEWLASHARALVTFLDGSEAGDATLGVAPQDELEAWMESRGWVLGGIDDEDGFARLTAEATAAMASAAARQLAAGYLRRAAAWTRALPEPALAEALRRLGPDPFRLAAQFQVAPLDVFHRLAFRAAPHEAQARPTEPMGLVCCDASGSLTFSRPIAGFPVPRLGAACALWPIYTALSRPGSPVERVVETVGASPRRFRVIALAETRHPLGMNGPELHEAAMLILPLSGAMLAAGAPPPLRMGPSCRICSLAECPARREPSIIAGDI